MPTVAAKWRCLERILGRGIDACSTPGEGVETPMVSQKADFTSSRAFRVAGPTAFAEAGITHNDVDHLMIYDAPCSLPGAELRAPSDLRPRRSGLRAARR